MQDSSTCFQSNFINDAATSYTVTYFDSLSGIRCGSENISASLCIDRRCSKTFYLSLLCSNSTSISVSVYATSILGDGRESDPVTAVVGWYKLYDTINGCVIIIFG